MEIALRSVWHSYDGLTYALKDVSLTFRSPGVHVVVGPNGAGKTTLLKVVSLIIKPSKGLVLVNGQSFWDLDTSRRDAIRRAVVYVHDKPILVRGTTRYNVELGLKLRSEADDSTVDYYITRYGLKEVENKHVSKLSAGQAKTVSIIRALVLKPKVLVLDEPFTFLDSTRVALLLEDITKLAEEGMVIVATHYMQKSLRSIASQVVEIINGEVSSTEAK